MIVLTGAPGEAWYDGFTGYSASISGAAYEEPRMTVIAAWMLRDAVLIASDSNVRTDRAYDTPSVKLRRVDDLLIVWAGTGEDEPIDDFRRWLSRSRWTSQTGWSEIRASTKAALAGINAAKRESMKTAGVRAKRRDLAKVLMAGYAAGEPNILELTERGESYLLEEKGFGVIGSGAPHFQVARATTIHMRKLMGLPEEIDQKPFWLMVAVAADTDPESKLPLQRCTISRERVQCVEGTEQAVGVKEEDGSHRRR